MRLQLAIVGALTFVAVVAACASFGSATDTGETADAGDFASPADARLGAPRRNATPGVRCPFSPNGCGACCEALGATGWFTPNSSEAGPCAQDGGCPANFSTFSCDDPFDCIDAATGPTCCSTRNAAGTPFQGSACVVPAACPPDALHTVLCDPADEPACPDGKQCMPGDPNELPPLSSACR